MQGYLLSLSVSLSPGAEQEPQRMRVVPPDNRETEMDGRWVDGWMDEKKCSFEKDVVVPGWTLAGLLAFIQQRAPRLQ